MLNIKAIHIISFIVAVIVCSCSPKLVATKYYQENHAVLDHIEKTYSELYRQKPFTIAFTDKKFQTISLEIITDSLKYIYEFNVNERRILDSLQHYKMDATAILNLIGEMKSIRCTWVNNFDHYVNGRKKSLIFISVKPPALTGFLSKKRYYILTYFTQPQYYDQEGRLLDNRRQRELQKLNGEIFHRINDKVSYTVSSNYR